MLICGVKYIHVRTMKLGLFTCLFKQPLLALHLSKTGREERKEDRITIIRGLLSEREFRELIKMKNMVSRERKRAAAASASYKKLQMLRSLTNSLAQSKTSVILDATKYIEELKQRVERINEDIAMAQSSTCQNSYNPVQLRVELQDNSFLIKVFSERCCRGLLVFVLEAFEELGLDVLQARVSRSECFLLEAVGVKDDQGSDQCLAAQDVQRAISEAIQNWTTQVNEQQ